MFDVPVLEVTASSAPALFLDGVKQANQISLYKPNLSSTFLNALATLSHSHSHQLNALLSLETEDLQSDQVPTKALLPDRSFQHLEPLNLANAAISLEVALNPPPESAVSPLENISLSSTSPVIEQTPQITNETSDNLKLSDNIMHSPVVKKLEKAAPVIPSEALSQCIGFPHNAKQGHTTFKVVSHGEIVGEISSIEGPKRVALALQEMLTEPINPYEIAPLLGAQPSIRLSKDAAIQLHQQQTLDKNILNEADKPTLSNEWAAIAWSDQLRQAMGAPSLDAGNIQVMLKKLQPSERKLNGIASWYGPYFHGRRTANGETFNQNTLTAAHKSLPFNTVLQVRNLNNDRTVVVRINDRGPYIGKRSLDLSKAAAQCLDSKTIGVIPYEAVILE